MKKFTFYLLSLTLAIFAETCEPGEEIDDPCGKRDTVMSTWGKGFTEFLDDTGFYNYIEGNNRVFQVSSSVIHNVCPESHIQLKFFTSIDRPDSLPLEREMRCRLRYVYGPFGIYGSTIYTDKTSDYQTSYDLSGNGEFGIKNAYDTDPGAFFVALEWVMDNYQDEQVDINYFVDYLKYGAFEIHYKEFKETQ